MPMHVPNKRLLARTDSLRDDASCVSIDLNKTIVTGACILLPYYTVEMPIGSFGHLIRFPLIDYFHNNVM